MANAPPTGSDWPREWLRGLLPLSVLAAVAEHDRHGYAVASRLRENGLGDIKGGTLYPVLARLEEDGLVTSAWQAGSGGPGRKVFSATRAGRDHLLTRLHQWQDFATRTTDLLAAAAASHTDQEARR